MANGSRNQDDTLLVVFSTATPISADDIASLLRDMSADYKRATGGTLVLARYETGSSWIYLRDAIAVAGSIAGAFNDMTLAVQNMRTFVRLLIDGFPNSATPPTPPSQVEVVAKSVARIAKIAADNGAYVNLEYLKDEKEGLESYTFHMNNQIARRLHKEGVSHAHSRAAALFNSSTDSVVDARRTVKRTTANHDASSEIVEAVLTALKSRSGDNVLPTLADDLEADGRADIAHVVRRYMEQ